MNLKHNNNILKGLGRQSQQTKVLKQITHKIFLMTVLQANNLVLWERESTTTSSCWEATSSQIPNVMKLMFQTQ